MSHLLVVKVGAEFRSPSIYSCIWSTSLPEKESFQCKYPLKELKVDETVEEALY